MCSLAKLWSQTEEKVWFGGSLPVLYRFVQFGYYVLYRFVYPGPIMFFSCAGPLLLAGRPAILNMIRHDFPCVMFGHFGSLAVHWLALPGPSFAHLLLKRQHTSFVIDVWFNPKLFEYFIIFTELIITYLWLSG